MPGFKEIIGHEHIIEYFERSIRQNHVSHAYLISGEKESGKKTLAKAFAMALQCQIKTGEACGCCRDCLQALSDNHPDIIYVTHEKSAASISVEEIRQQLVDDVQIRPYSGAYKIYIVDEAEKMTLQAQNALLKTLEEPPSYTVILLLTTSLEAFLPTIISRCINLQIKPLPDERVKVYLEEVKGLSDYDADICTAFARGNLGKAISLAESESFKQLKERMLFLLKHIKEMDLSEVLLAMQEWQNSGMDIQMCLDFMVLWYRDILLFKATRETSSFIFKEEYSYIRKISETSDFAGIETILKAIETAKTRLRANVNFLLTMELLMLVIREN